MAVPVKYSDITKDANILFGDKSYPLDAFKGDIKFASSPKGPVKKKKKKSNLSCGTRNASNISSLINIRSINTNIFYRFLR